MKKLVLAAPILALALGGSSACATKKMVRQNVGEVNAKVETLSKSVEENQQRTLANEALEPFARRAISRWPSTSSARGSRLASNTRPCWESLVPARHSRWRT